jgi:hypothetical protein
LVALVRDLLERVERQATEIAQFRALTVQAESLRADRELSELRARLTSLETRAPHQAQATPLATADADARGATRAPAQPAAPIWLPPSATAAPAPTPAPPAQRLPEPPPNTFVGWGWNRVVVLILEAAFIVFVALGATLAGLDPLAVLAVIGLAWFVVAAAEAVAWHRRRF